MLRVRTPPRLVIAFALAVTAASCASTPQEHHHGRREGHRGERGAGGGVSLFISPAGQPFRAGSDDPYPVAAWFAEADADHDGKLTPAEFRADAARFFRKIDLDGDGVIEPAEATAYEHNLVPEILASPGGEAAGAGRSGGGWGGGNGGGGGGWGGRRGGGRHHGGDNSTGQTGQARERLQGAAPYTLNRQSEPVTSADLNFDGKVTMAEFLASADRHFAELEASGPGYLTLAALPKTAVQERRARRHDQGD